jgi:tetraacyldisaccharide 4'-kinase
MREPSWWYPKGPEPWVSRALLPVGALYGALSGSRMQRPALYRAKVPVICVGNFTAGGTGKTPFVRTLIGMLRKAGHTIDRARDTAADVGDEPLLLAGDAPVVVARDRVAGARAIESGGQGVRASVIVMDDGLQNPTLAKDLSIAVVDAARGFGNQRCIPAGPMRAPLATQLLLVQAVVLNTGSGTLAPASTPA